MNIVKMFLLTISAYLLFITSLISAAILFDKKANKSKNK